MKQFLREPFFHFVLLGAGIFVLYGIFGGGEEAGADNEIVVTPARVQNLAALFRHTWQREPTPAEINELVDAYVREEVFYREGLAMGLDRDDAIIRQRVERKMQTVAAPDVTPAPPTDAQLAAFREAHPEQFGAGYRYDFRQVFIDPSLHGDGSESMAGATLMALQAGAGAQDWAALGDTGPLPTSMENASPAEIADRFGGDFADEIKLVKGERWAGPLKSGHGLHLVQVTKREEQPAPPLAEVRELVVRAWNEDQRRQAADALYTQLREKYTVVIAPEALPSAATETR